MKCLITGINGFAGSYLAEYILQIGEDISGTIYPENSVQNIKNILNKINALPCDITIPGQIENIINTVRPDCIFHLAGQSFVPLSWSKPIETFKANVFGTIYLLKAVKRFSEHARILIVGSGDEYGMVTGHTPVKETAPLNPQNPYALTKACADILGKQFGDLYNLKTIMVRPFPHIGPRQSANFVVSDFSKQIAMIEKGIQEPKIKTGNLDTKLDFTDVRDMVKAYWLAIEKCTPGNVYNISSGNLYSIKEILSYLLSQTSVEIKVESDPAKFRIHDTALKTADSQKFRTQTGWKPNIPIEETLKETLNWWRQKTLTD